MRHSRWPRFPTVLLGALVALLLGFAFIAHGCVSPEQQARIEEAQQVHDADVAAAHLDLSSGKLTQAEFAAALEAANKRYLAEMKAVALSIKAENEKVAGSLFHPEQLLQQLLTAVLTGAATYKVTSSVRDKTSAARTAEDLDKLGVPTPNAPPG